MNVRAESKKPLLWLAASAVAALGTWIMFDALPGINWGLWTLAAATGLQLFVDQRNRSVTLLLSGIAVIIAFGASITADPFMNALTCLGVIVFLAMTMLLSTDAPFNRITAVFTVPAPIIAFTYAMVEAVRRAVQALHVVRSNRTQSVLRGIAITIPVVVVFALLLSSADPVFAGFRDSIEQILQTLNFLPRTIFFVALLALVIGTYGFAAAEQQPILPLSGPAEHKRWLGTTEQLILLSSVTLLFWTFLAIQLSYFFGNSANVAKSGMTLAEYARRGFGELTVVATASVLLILFCNHFATRDGRRRQIAAITVALIIAVLFLLGSALHRVSLYEEAYGFTTARLYAQAYMLVTAVALIALALEVRTEIDSGRLFRRAGAAATLAFIVLIYWNHQAWIARHNIDLQRVNGRLDSSYLTRDLSIDAVTAVLARLETLPEPQRSVLRNALLTRYRGKPGLFRYRWYEWNRARSAARSAMNSTQTQP